MKHINFCLLFIASVIAAAVGCASPPTTAPGVSVRELAGPWVAPESCTRAPDGWVVSEQGCGFEQPCRAGDAALGRVVLVRDDGSTETLIDGLKNPNGVAVDADGRVWVAVGGTGEIVVVGTDGSVTKTAVKDAGLLNDVAPAPFHPGAAWVSDSVSGAVYLAALTDGRVDLAPFGKVPAANGLAPSQDGDGVAVSTLGDLEIPGKPGAIATIDSASAELYEACADWHGGAVRATGGPEGRKLDGLVPADGGYLASAIYDVTGDKLSAEIWFVPVDGGAAKLVFDGAKHGIRSAADIGRDPKTGDICIPDLNGSNDLKADGAAAAKVLIVSGLAP